MTSYSDEPLKALHAKLNEADAIVEQTLKAHAIDDLAYDTLKHEVVYSNLHLCYECSHPRRAVWT